MFYTVIDFCFFPAKNFLLPVPSPGARTVQRTYITAYVQYPCLSSDLGLCNTLITEIEMTESLKVVHLSSVINEVS